MNLFDKVKNVNMQIQKKRRHKKEVNFNYGWGNQSNKGSENQGNNGWGNQGNDGWGNQGNDGWGNQGGNNGWGNQGGNDGWGNQGGNQGNNGWGNQGGNDGWGNQGGNNGWGNQGGNNGWGNQGGNNGWGNSENSGWGNQGSNFGLENALFGNQQMWGNNLSGSAWVQEQIKRQAFSIMVPGQQQNQFNLNDIQSILEKQIVFIEPSPSEKKLEELKKQGKTFNDDRFPPNQTSLTGEWGHVHEWSEIKWKRISETMPSSKIFQGKVEPGDIKQGYLGDCYFLAGLAALAQRPDRIFNLFLLTETNNVKYYSVKMIYKGKWMTIDMDEYVPYLYNSPAFTKAKDDELWVVLLEKAWAKLYTSYKRIEAGYPEEALHDLTGAPVRNLYLKQASFDKEKEWKYLLKASQREYSMVASSRPGSDTTKSETGIVQGHAYTFLNATYLRYSNHQERIVQLRNPWGKGQSKGRWSDDDPNWQYVSQTEKERIGYKKDSKDGIFFMTYDDFLLEFRALAVAEINDNASYIYKSIKDPQLKGAYFKLEIVQKGLYSLHVDKTPERSFTDKKQDHYRYPQAQLQLSKLQNGVCQKLDGSVSARRTLYKQYQLEPGVYVAYVKIHFDKNYDKECDINLAVYAEYFCDIEIATREQAIAFTGNPNVQWSGIVPQQTKPWNNMGNNNWNSGWGNQGGNSGWNNQGGGNNGWGNEGGNNGWGNQGGNQGNNGWGNQGGNNGWGNQGGNQGNNGWGNQGGNQGNNGWGNQGGNQGNNGWGNQGGNQGNNGWGNQGGNQGNNGWGNQGGNQGNNGWGNQGGNQGNNGWGNEGGNNGWGKQGGNQSNNGWGNQGGNQSNNGWGNQGSNNGWGNQKNNGW